MWKRQGAAELVGRYFEHRIRADGTPVSLDLQHEKYVGSKGWKTVANATQFPGPTVRVWREPFLFDPQSSRPNSWRYELIWPGCKFQTTKDIFCYLAPVDGYAEKIAFSFNKADADFRLRDECTFYFVNQQGQFGRGSINIRADYTEEEAYVNLSVCWNPDGSRNLEPKPE